MKGSPEASISLAVAEESNFLRRDLGNAERIENVNQLAVAAAVNEGIKKPWSFRCVDIFQRAQFTIVPQSFARELLIVTIKFACPTGLRSTIAHCSVG